MVLLMIAAITLRIYRSEQTDRDQSLQGVAWANALQQVCDAADTYATRNWPAVSAQPTTTLPMAPLVGIPPLTMDIATTLDGATVTATVIMSPAGCSAAADTCRADVRVYTGALPGTAAQRYALANNIVRRVGDLASQSLPENPAVLVNRKSQRTDPNPSNVAGAVMLRCGEANVGTTDTGLRGNRQMTNALNSGDHNLTFNDVDTSTMQINVSAGTTCSQQNQVALGTTGRFMYCNGATWQSAAMPITQTKTTHTFQ